MASILSRESFLVLLTFGFAVGYLLDDQETAPTEVTSDASTIDATKSSTSTEGTLTVTSPLLLYPYSFWSFLAVLILACLGIIGIFYFIGKFMRREDRIPSFVHHDVNLPNDPNSRGLKSEDSIRHHMSIGDKSIRGSDSSSPDESAASDGHKITVTSQKKFLTGFPKVSLVSDDCSSFTSGSRASVATQDMPLKTVAQELLEKCEVCHSMTIRGNLLLTTIMFQPLHGSDD